MSTQNKTAHDVKAAKKAMLCEPGSSRGLRNEKKQCLDHNKKNKGVSSGSLEFLDAQEEMAAELENFKPLTRQEAIDVRRQIQSVSMFRVLVVQLMAGVLVALICWAATGRQNVGWSALYGAMAVIFPAAIFARGLARQKSVLGAGSALTGFFVWELVKIGTTVAMLLVAPRLVFQLSWLALLAGFVVTMKVYWLATWLQLAHPKSVKKI